MRYILCCCSLLLVQTTHGHHSSVGIYDEENLVEIEGVVTSLRWRNPHPTFTVEVEDENGESVEWEIETGSVVWIEISLQSAPKCDWRGNPRYEACLKCSLRTCCWTTDVRSY